MSTVIERYQLLQERIEQAARDWGRDPQGIRLMAVSKTVEQARLLPLLEKGHRFFGENRVQEAMQKFPPLYATHPDIDLHLIGPLQTNKVKIAVKNFSAIHSLDRPKLADYLARSADEAGQCPNLFIEVNLADEPQKSGVTPQDFSKFLSYCQSLSLPMVGLMCVPPNGAEPAPYFALLAKMARDNGLKELSMGMSHDFETAIAHGATIIRLGSALFGSRQ